MSDEFTSLLASTSPQHDVYVSLLANLLTGSLCTDTGSLSTQFISQLQFDLGDSTAESDRQCWTAMTKPWPRQRFGVSRNDQEKRGQIEWWQVDRSWLSSWQHSKFSSGLRHFMLSFACMRHLLLLYQPLSLLAQFVRGLYPDCLLIRCLNSVKHHMLILLNTVYLTHSYKLCRMICCDAITISSMFGNNDEDSVSWTHCGT